jgi:phenylacetate-CoA ligase
MKYFNEEMETMPRNQLAKLQLERLRQTLELAYNKVPFHRQRFEAAGVKPSDLKSLEDLSRFPFTKKTDLRENYPFGLFAEPVANCVRLHASSGTKGKPTVVGYTRNDIEVWSEIVARAIVCAGGQPDDVLHIAYGYGLFTGGLGLHYGGEKLGATVVPVSGGNTPRQIMLMQDFGAVGLCCTPSYALNIAEVMDEMKIDRATIKLKYGILGAEPWTEEIRAQIEEQLGVVAYDIYGLSEVMGPGVSMEGPEKNGLHVWEDHFLPEIVDPHTGEPLPYGQEGELVFTSLSKEAFPVVRYRTGDLCTLYNDPVASGRTHVRMSKIKGRTDDMLIIRGVNVFPSEIERVLLGFNEIAPHYQIVLERPETLDVVSVETEVTVTFAHHEFGDHFNPESEILGYLKRKIGQGLQQALGVNLDIRINAPHSVPRSEGKAVRVVDKRPK